MSELIQAVDSEEKAICAHFSVICAIKKAVLLRNEILKAYADYCIKPET